MHILITKDIPRDVVNYLRDELDIKEEPRLAMHKSESAPSFLQIIGEIIQWLDPLKVAATAFLLELSREAAKDVYKNKAKIIKALKVATVTSLNHFSEVLSRIKKNLPSRTKVAISIPIPDNFFGTTLLIESDKEEEIAWAIANFIVRIEAISKFIKKISESELKPFAPLHLTLLEDGNLKLTWMDQKNMEMHEKVFNCNK
jgi:hypothetical protein